MIDHTVTFENKLSNILLESVSANGIIQAINKVRELKDLEPVEPNDDIRIAARTHATAMASLQEFGHVLDRAKYPKLSDRMRLTGYSYSDAGEVLAAGIDDPDRVIRAWLNSPPHRKAILHPDVEEIGASVQYTKNGDPYVCAVLCIPQGGSNAEDDEEEDEDDFDSIANDVWQAVKKYGKRAGKNILHKLAQTDKAKEIAKSPIIQKIVAALR
jgi:ribosome maturation protein Sdo1